MSILNNLKYVSAYNPTIEVSYMIKHFREAETATEGMLLTKLGIVSITIPAHTNMVHFLRHMFNEHKGGKLYIPRVPDAMKWGEHYASNWSLIMWGGGRQRTKNIKCLDVRKNQLPKPLQLLDLMG